MLKKSTVFGLLAATLMVAPSSVFAQNQSTENDSSVKNQTSIMRSTRVQKSVTGRSRRGYRCPSTKTSQQSQDSRQTSVQEGVAENNSTNTQNVDSISSQVQRIRTRVLCQ